MSDAAWTIDLNADLGEGFPWDRALLERVSSASVSCGAHAGDEAVMRRAIAGARERGVAVGAHPGYADREHFGRRELSLPPGQLRDQLLTQVENFGLLALEEGVVVGYLKPHGALYNQAQRDRNVAVAVVSAAQILRLPLVGQAGTVLEELAAEDGVRLVREGFLDRRYDRDGRLVSRKRADAFLESAEEVEAQVEELLGRGVETLCLHGDREGVVELADQALAMLGARGVEVRSFVR